MIIAVLRFAISLIVVALLSSAQETLDLAVEHVRAFRNTRGTLHVDVGGMVFLSDDKKTAIRISLENLRRVDVADPKALHFETYDVNKWKPIERRQYTFRAPADAPVEELARFFATHTIRPVSGHYVEPSEFRTLAYHRRRLGGTHGTLEIGPESIQYVSESPSDSRTWLYRDIETFGRPDALRFRVTSGRETYVLELQERMPQSAYDLAWTKVYGISKR